MAPSCCHCSSQKLHGCYCVRVGVNFLHAGAEFLSKVLVSPGCKVAQWDLSLRPATRYVTPRVEARRACQGSAHSWRYLIQIPRQQQQSGEPHQCRMSRDHVSDKVPVSWGISHGTCWSPCPQGDINGDTLLVFSFQFVQDPGILFRDFLSKWDMLSPTLKKMSTNISGYLFTDPGGSAVGKAGKTSVSFSGVSMCTICIGLKCSLMGL